MIAGFGATQGVPGTIASTVGGGLLSAAPFTGPAAPFVAVAGALAEVGGALLGVFGVGVPDMKKIQATTDANQVEQLMAQNQQAFLSGPHTVANQQLAEQTFYALWNQLVQLCSNPNLGTAGQNCISDRQRGGRWDWFAMHLDPIMNVVPVDANPVTDAGASISSSLGISPLWLGVGLLVLGVLSD